MSKIQTGLRLPQERYEELVDIAKSAGTSVNALALILIDIGLSVLTLGTEEAFHSMLRNLQDTSGR